MTITPTTNGVPSVPPTTQDAAHAALDETQGGARSDRAGEIARAGTRAEQPVAAKKRTRMRKMLMPDMRTLLLMGAARGISVVGKQRGRLTRHTTY